ncbi:MAG: lipid-A-disaccharide synthase [Planctomycetota bacterium]
MPDGVPRIFMIAGETSGDHYAGGLARAILAAAPGAAVRGMGGPELADAGAAVLWDFEGLDVMGFWDVLTRLGRFRRLFRDLVADLDRDPPDAVVLVDYPGFNLRFARAAHARGIPVIYFISPKVWAWKPGRIKVLARYCRRMLVLFAFEEEVYRSSGLPTVCVGHPLAGELAPYRNARPHWRRELDYPGDIRLVGLLPGSRAREVERMFPPMLAAAARLHRRFPGIRFAAGSAPGFAPDYLKGFVRPGYPPVDIIGGRTHALMAAADALMITSGTATLEAALIGTPHVLCYRVGWLTYLLVKPLLHTRNVGMANIAAGRVIMPELLQSAMSPDRIADTVAAFLEDEVLRRRGAADCEALFTALRADDPYGRAAAEVLAVAGEAGHGPAGRA